MEVEEAKVVAGRPEPAAEAALTLEPIGTPAEAVSKDVKVRVDRPVAAARHWYTSRSA